MDQLPFEILTSIGGYLSTRKDLHACTLVNHSFYEATNHLLWRQPKGNQRLLTCLEAAAQATNPHHVLAIGKHVQILELGHIEWSDDDFLFVMQHTPHLQTLALAYPRYISETSLQRLPTSYPSLTSLGLSRVPIDQLTMQALGQHCKQLTRLSLTDCHHLAPDALSALVSLPLAELAITQPGLSAIQIPIGFDRLTDLSLDFWDDSLNVDRVLHQGTWPHLKMLSIAGYTRGDDASSSALPGFLQAHPSLQTLHLISGQFNDSLLTSLTLIQHPGITSLDLSHNRRINAAGVRPLVLAWPQLTNMSLSSCGISGKLFREASINCLRYKNHREWQRPGSHLQCLDHQAIINIRRKEAAKKAARKK